MIVSSARKSMVTSICVCLFVVLGSSNAQAAGQPAAQAGEQAPLTQTLSAAKSGRYVMEHDHGRVHWSISHHGFSTFTAVLPKVDAILNLDATNISNSSVEAAVHMTDVDSSIDAFDERLNGKSFFNTEKYTTATFKSTKVVSTGGNSFTVYGDLTFLGVTKPAVMEATFAQAGHSNSPPAGYRLGFDATMVMDRTEFGMSKSTLGDKVALRIEAEFVDEATAAKH